MRNQPTNMHSKQARYLNLFDGVVGGGGSTAAFVEEIRNSKGCVRYLFNGITFINFLELVELL